MILCREGELGAAIEGDVQILLSRRKGFAARNQTVRADNQHYCAHVVDAGKPWRIDILPSDTESAEMQ